jgi:hypothetical protein
MLLGCYCYCRCVGEDAVGAAAVAAVVVNAAVVAVAAIPSVDNSEQRRCSNVCEVKRTPTISSFLHVSRPIHAVQPTLWAQGCTDNVTHQGGGKPKSLLAVQRRESI